MRIAGSREGACIRDQKIGQPPVAAIEPGRGAVGQHHGPSRLALAPLAQRCRHLPPPAAGGGSAGRFPPGSCTKRTPPGEAIPGATPTRFGAARLNPDPPIEA